MPQRSSFAKVLGGIVLGTLLFGAIFLFVSKGDIDADPAMNARNRALSEQEFLDSALGQFFKQNGRYPSAEEGLAVLYGTSLGGPYVRGPMFKADPWNSPYVYQQLNDGKDYRLYSIGPNKTDEAGAGDDLRSPRRQTK
jgi:general secretion pathway protein G